MSFERIIVGGLSTDDNDLTNFLLKQLDDRSDRNQRRSEYYDGKRALRQISPVVPPQYHHLGLVLGWSAKAVDALARRCMIESFTWPGGDLDSLGMATLTEDNMLLSELSGAISKQFIHGVSFLVNTTGVEGEPRSLIHAKDALNATGVWNVRRRSLDSLISVTCRQEDKPVEFVLYLDGDTVPCSRVDGRWKVGDRQSHVYGVPAEPLIYRPQGRPFGYSRISRPIMGLQDAAVRSLVRMEGHMDIYSYPELVTLGADSSVFQDDAGNTLPAWQVMLGRIKMLPDRGSDDPDFTDSALDRADVKQFPATSPQPHLAQLNALAKMFAREASLPDSAVAITDMANPTSADAYDASQYELIAEAEGAVDDVIRPISRSVRRGLQILNAQSDQPVEWASIVPKFRNPRFESRAQAADAGSKTLAALPWLAQTEVGLELMGMSESQITRALAEQRRARGSEVLDALRTAAAQVTSANPA